MVQSHTDPVVLIVDDKPENLFALKRILEVNNFQADTASSGEEALKKVLKKNYALVLLDVQMPIMDGFEVAEAISSSSKTKDIPIIFLSAVNTHKKFIAKGLESGAVEYLTKPVDPDILVLKVKNFYKLYEKTLALKEAERALSITVNELHSTLESIPQIAFTARPDGKIDFVNQHWHQFALGKDQFPEVHPKEEPIEQRWSRLIAIGKPIEEEVFMKPIASEEYQYFLLRVRPVFVHGIISKWVGTFTNIHQQKMLNETLERRVAERTRELLEMNRELEISNHDLQQFASVASHDLKEPLRKIQVFGHLLKEKADLSDATATYVEKIIFSSGRMSRLINDLLNFARLSEAEVFEEADIVPIIKDILTDLELSIEEKKAVVEVEPVPKLEVVPSLISQLFQNLLSNSLKFARPNIPPHIRISAELINEPYLDHPASEDGNYCRIKVEDNGIGFDEKYLDKIFTLFQRLTTKEKHEGTGIGLAIAKKIVEKHNGVIAARSKPDEGSCFLIILPVRQSNMAARPSMEIHSSSL